MSDFEEEDTLTEISDQMNITGTDSFPNNSLSSQTFQIQKSLIGYIKKSYAPSEKYRFGDQAT
jgi:hypothetical protein